MRRSASLILFGLAAAAGGCSDDDKGGTGPGESYDVQSATTAITVPQDNTHQLAVTVKRGDQTTIAAPVISYSVEDYTIATVNSTGLVTGKKGGTTNVRAAFNGDTLFVPVTVTPKPATSAQLTLNFTGKDSGTVGGLPGFPAGTFLKALVLAGTDTVYCNALACRDHATRTQRLVEFVSLDTTKATIANASASTANKNTRGQINVRDTSANYVKFVLRVPADGISDTVFLRFNVRPIDSITVRTDSFTVAGTTTRVAYSSNIARDSSIVLALTLQNRLDTAYTLNATTGAQVRTRTTVTVTRPSMPRITWESANENYAVVDNQGRVTGLRNTWMPGIGTGTNARNTSDEPSCDSRVFKTSPTDVAFFYDRVLTRFPIPATYTPAVVATGCPATVPGPLPTDPPVPTNVPANVARGVNCTSATVGPLATCTVVIRATITDPATGATRQALFNVVIRQP